MVRVPFDYRLFTPEDYPGIWTKLGFDLLDKVVEWSAKAGLYVLLDMHAAPCGQTGANIDNSYRVPGFIWRSSLPLAHGGNLATHRCPLR